MTMSIPWWRSGAPIRKKEDLPLHVPRPGDNKGHVLPYAPKIGDDWRLIEQLLETDGRGRQARVQMQCGACGVKTTVIVYIALYDETVKWLCGDCVEDGYRWGSTIPRDAYVEYQIVKQFPDDTLLRRLDRSISPKEEVHRPVDAAERLARQPLKRKTDL